MHYHVRLKGIHIGALVGIIPVLALVLLCRMDTRRCNSSSSYHYSYFVYLLPSSHFSLLIAICIHDSPTLFSRMKPDKLSDYRVYLLLWLVGQEAQYELSNNLQTMDPELILPPDKVGISFEDFFSHPFAEKDGDLTLRYTMDQGNVQSLWRQIQMIWKHRRITPLTVIVRIYAPVRMRCWRNL